MLEGPAIFHLSESVQKLVVILHGYGANGANLIDLAQEWAPQFPDTDFLAPNGPDVCEMNPFGFQWFGLKDFSPFNIRAGLDRVGPMMVGYLQSVLQERQLTPKDLVLVGFSQGSMLALDMIFALPGLRGVLAYSGAFYPPVAAESPSSPPAVLLIHGMMDTIVPFGALKETERQLKLFGVHSETHATPHLGHGIDEEGVRLGGQFLKKLFSKN